VEALRCLQNTNRKTARATSSKSTPRKTIRGKIVSVLRHDKNTSDFSPPSCAKREQDFAQSVFRYTFTSQAPALPHAGKKTAQRRQPEESCTHPIYTLRYKKKDFIEVDI